MKRHTFRRIFSSALTIVVGGVSVLSALTTFAQPAAATIEPQGYEVTTVLADSPVDVSNPSAAVVTSPDGLWTLFYKDSPTDLHSVPTAGGTPRRLDANATFNEVSPDSSRVVYLDEVGYASRSIAGSTEVRLFVTSDTDQMTITGDGQHVLFRVLVAGSTGQFDLWSVPIDGGTPVRLNPPLVGKATIESFATSPDGQRVVFRRHTPGAADELLSVAVTGGAAAVINGPMPADAAIENIIQFSPDGRYVLYAMDDPATLRRNHYSVGPDGSVHLLTANAFNYSTSFHLAIDNSRLVVVVTDGIGKSQLLTSTLDGSSTTVLYTAAALESLAAPMLSPTVAWVAFSVGLTSTANREVKSVAIDGSGLHSVINTVRGRVALAPDGITIVSGEVGASVVQSSIDGSKPTTTVVPFKANVTKITADGRKVVLSNSADDSIWVAALDATSPEYVNVLPYTNVFTNTVRSAVSPDGRRIVAMQDRGVDGQYGLYAAGPGYADGLHSIFEPLTPTRVLDTRPTELIGYSGGKPVAGAVVKVPIRGRAGIPNSNDVKAVVLNVTHEVVRNQSPTQSPR